MKWFIALLLLSASAFAAEAYRPLDHLWWGVRDAPDTHNAVVLGAGTALTLGALAFDPTVKNFFAGRERIGDWNKVGNFWGVGITEGALGVGAIAYGLLAHSDRELNAGEAELETLALTGATTGALKLAVGRERPDSGSHTSFPSGHTSSAFTLVGTGFEIYGPSVGVPFAVLGGFTAVSRLATNVHWLSDTIFGATLGLLWGHAYGQHHHSAKAGQPVAVIPYFENRQDFGVDMRLAF